MKLMQFYSFLKYDEEMVMEYYEKCRKAPSNTIKK